MTVTGIRAWRKSYWWLLETWEWLVSGLEESHIYWWLLETWLTCIRTWRKSYWWLLETWQWLVSGLEESHIGGYWKHDSDWYQGLKKVILVVTGNMTVTGIRTWRKSYWWLLETWQWLVSGLEESHIDDYWKHILHHECLTCHISQLRMSEMR